MYLRQEVPVIQFHLNPLSSNPTDGQTHPDHSLESSILQAENLLLLEFH